MLINICQTARHCSIIADMERVIEYLLCFTASTEILSADDGMWFKGRIFIYATRSCHHRNGDRAARRPHIVCSICVRSFGALAKEICTIVHCITSQPANASWNVLYWHFRQPPTGSLKFINWTFRPPVCRMSGMGPFDNSPIGSY